jgi:hypothetical protein
MPGRLRQDVNTFVETADFVNDLGFAFNEIQALNVSQKRREHSDSVGHVFILMALD